MDEFLTDCAFTTALYIADHFHPDVAGEEREALVNTLTAIVAAGLESFAERCGWRLRRTTPPFSVN
jgi:hypothetical protein